MAALNQPRDWHGRWTSLGGGGLGPAGRSGALYARNPRSRMGRGSVTFSLSSKPGRIGVVGRQASRSSARIGTRPGSPIRGHKNLRYVSRTQAIARNISLPGSAARGLGRASSIRGARQLSRGTSPRHGYIVAYGPRGQAVVRKAA